MCIFEILFFKFLSKKKKSLKPYIPKEATQQELFVSKHPKFDGRGIKIAIIDSGLDVSLEGMQETSESLPKIIDCFNFTGIGDVDTSVVKEMNSKNILIGLSGRKFKIPKQWINPSGKWHLGIKALYKPASAKVAEKLPELDCIVWFNGTKWLACIETAVGNLENAKILTTFRDAHEYGILVLKKLKIPYCITVHNDGNLLEIFTPCDHHGTVVAQIAAAHFPQNPKSDDGLAPGAQMIFMSVWDPRAESLINLEAIKKAFLKCIEMKVDIINMSVQFTGTNEMRELIDEMINKHGILLFKCAGNFGPFSGSSVKYGFCNFDATLAIGAALTSEMKKRIWNFSSFDNSSSSPPSIYWFSSRGPGFSASRGLDFVAPGAAIVRMPQFYAQKYQYRDGTSISAPNAAGAVACLISGLKAKSIQYSAASIKFALFKTAFLPENGNKLEFGHGIIQIDSAFNYYCKSYPKVPTFPTDSKGIHFVMRDKINKERDMDLSDFIDYGGAEAENWALELCPKAKTYMELSNIDVASKSFSLKLHPNTLEDGIMNYSEIQITDALIGSIFHIPVITVNLLHITENYNFNYQKEIILLEENPHNLLFRPFFKENKKCEIKISALESSITTTLGIYHIIRDEKIDFVKALKTQSIFKFTPKNSIEAYCIPIARKEIPQISNIHEICIHQAIGSPPKSMFKLEFAFKND